MTARLFERRSEVVFIASSGGHLELLLHIGGSASKDETAWVTIDGTRADSLREEGRIVYTLPRLNKENLNMRNPLGSPRLAWRLRPRIVVTSGAGMVVFFCVASKLLGSQLCFVETMARISKPSLTGRLLARISDQMLVQWPELLDAYPQATLCHPLLLEDIQAERLEGAGTFVSLGTHDAPFDRLLAIVDDAIEAGLLPEPLVVQSGPSTYVARNFTSTPWMSRKEFTDAVGSSRYIVGHAGAGLASAALQFGRKPLLLSRRRSLGEHVDDHQLQLAEKLEQLGLAVCLGDAISARDITAADAPLPADTLLSQGIRLSQAVDQTIQAARGLG